MGSKMYRNILVQGQLYPTIRAAAAAFGVRHDTMLAAMHAGKLDSIGKIGTRGPAPMPVRVRGKVYASAQDAAKSLSVTRGAIYHAIARGSENGVGLPTHCKPRVGRRVKVGALDFTSMAEASRVLGFGEAYVSAAMRSDCSTARANILAAAMREAVRREGLAKKSDMRSVATC